MTDLGRYSRFIWTLISTGDTNVKLGTVVPLELNKNFPSMKIIPIDEFEARNILIHNYCYLLY